MLLDHYLIVLSGVSPFCYLVVCHTSSFIRFALHAAVSAMHAHPVSIAAARFEGNHQRVHVCSQQLIPTSAEPITASAG